MRSCWLVLVLFLAGCGGVSGLGSVQDVPMSTCASGKQWTGGNRESALMHPGLACVQCHTTSREGPRFTIAGTVFTDYNQADDCGGASASGLKVVITGNDGVATELPVNELGNFMLERGTVALPFSAKVVDGAGHERAMAAKQTVGDCNTCHTQTGAQSAPGRIIAP
jgi:hypothetical protein